MLEIIIALLLSLGIELTPESGNQVLVIDQASGESFGLGTSVGVGTRPPEPTITYFLVQDENGNYSLVQR